MPTYEYECTQCHERLEVEQRFTDDPLTICEHCGGMLRKVFSAVGVVFKGSGFYKTDSRPAAKSSASAGSTAGSDGGSSPTAPAAAAAATPSPAPSGD
jgi:putative FmdB family regulatory protein